MKTIKLTNEQKNLVEKMINAGKSFYTETKALFETDQAIRSLFLEKTVKEIAIEIFGDKINSDPKFALIENRQRTSLGNAIHNLKRLCRSQFGDKVERSPIKKYENVLNDLSNLEENFSSYKEEEQNSILNQIEKLVISLNKSLPKNKAIKIK